MRKPGQIQQHSRAISECLRASGRRTTCSVGAKTRDVMIIDLSGKHAIVSGSTSGIGFAIAQGLAASGATVVINGRSQKNVDASMSRLAGILPKAKVEGIAADLSSADGVAAFVTR